MREYIEWTLKWEKKQQNFTKIYTFFDDNTLSLYTVCNFNFNSISNKTRKFERHREKNEWKIAFRMIIYEYVSKHNDLLNQCWQHIDNTNNNKNMWKSVYLSIFCDRRKKKIPNEPTECDAKTKDIFTRLLHYIRHIIFNFRKLRLTCECFFFAKKKKQSKNTHF